MAKQQPEITLHLQEELLRKFLFVCEKENRNPSAQFAFMVRNNVAYYEKTKGRISQSDLAKIDISQFENK